MWLSEIRRESFRRSDGDELFRQALSLVRTIEPQWRFLFVQRPAGREEDYELEVAVAFSTAGMRERAAPYVLKLNLSVSSAIHSSRAACPATQRE